MTASSNPMSDDAYSTKVKSAFESAGHSTTFNSATSRASRSSRSSRMFSLDENDTHEILVYKVRSGYEISTQKKLCEELDKDFHWRCSRKPIPRGVSRLEVKTRDLLSEPERTTFKHYPNQSNSVASVGLPLRVYWRRLLLGQFSDLYIVSPDSSTDVSNAESNSDRTSPLDGSNPSWTGEEHEQHEEQHAPVQNAPPETRAT